jgi:hypothetical protein
MQGFGIAVIVVLLIWGLSILLGADTQRENTERAVTIILEKVEDGFARHELELSKHRYVSDCIILHGGVAESSEQVIDVCLEEAQQLELNEPVEDALIKNYPGLRGNAAP